MEFIRKYAADLNKQGAVVGLSGGIDSALVLKLCVEALYTKKSGYLRKSPIML
ncbi:MAG: hypothetical protein ACYCXB_03115 [Candidatus Humimicrobiaceae bacterium]